MGTNVRDVQEFFFTNPKNKRDFPDEPSIFYPDNQADKLISSLDIFLKNNMEIKIKKLAPISDTIEIKQLICTSIIVSPT